MGDILAEIAAEQERQHRRVREIVAEHGDQALAEYDAGMEHIRSGRYNMAMLWHSISEAQRRLLRLLGEGDRKLVRCSHSAHFYDAHGEPAAISKAAGTSTVAKLVRHGVLRWTGPAGNREQMAELASRGRELLASLKARN